MPILTGEIVTATRLNHLQPTTYAATANGTVGPSSTDADVPGATVTLTTETDNAVYEAIGSFQFDDSGGAPGGPGVGKLNVDGVLQSPQAIFRDSAATDRAEASKVWRGTLGAAGSHTLKLVATTPTNMSCVSGHTVIHVTIYEVV